jgi:hypothetical protein
MPAESHTTDHRPILASIFTVLGGLLMLASGPWMSAMMRHGMYSWGNPGRHMAGRWMNSHGYFCNWMPGYASGYMPGHLWTWLALLTGGGVLVAGIVMLARPDSHVGWGITILVSAAVALFMGAGGLLGVALAIIGGILAITYKPVTTPAGVSHNAQ